MYRILTFLVLLCACESQQSVDDTKPAISYTDEQRHVHSIIQKYNAKAFEAPNELQRRKFRDSIPIMITSYLHDTVKLIMKGFYVTVGEVNARPFRDIYALTAELSDEKIIYWMERDYATEQKMIADTIYKTIGKLKQGDERKINMAFVGDVEPDYIYGDKYRIRVIIMPDTLILKNKP